MVRAYQEFHFSGIDVRKEAIHSTAAGQRFLILHGDEFDVVVMHNKWPAHLGSGACDLLLWLNRCFNFARRKSW